LKSIGGVGSITRLTRLKGGISKVAPENTGDTTFSMILEEGVGRFLPDVMVLLQLLDVVVVEALVEVATAD